MKTTTNMTDLTTEQLSQVIGGDRKPPTLIRPNDPTSPVREIGSNHWSQEVPK